jgi:hypothetical protein
MPVIYLFLQLKNTNIKQHVMKNTMSDPTNQFASIDNELDIRKLFNFFFYI